jgi:hypothetical protein
MDGNETSSTQGATPDVDTPATGNPAPESATPREPAAQSEGTDARIAELERALKNATEERDRHRKKLSSYEEAERKAEEAKLSEIERVSKQYSELQSRHDTYVQQMQARIVRYEVERQATKLNIIDPDAATRLIDWSELEYDESGAPTNADKLLEKLLKQKPYLAPAKEPEPPARGNTPTIPAMNPGRSTIAAPDSVPQGRPVRLADVFQRP